MIDSWRLDLWNLGMWIVLGLIKVVVIVLACAGVIR